VRCCRVNTPGASSAACWRRNERSPKSTLTGKPKHAYDAVSNMSPHRRTRATLKESTMKGQESKKAEKKEPAKTMKEKKEAKKIKKAEKSR
jgi:hypothetical protein